MAEFTYKVETPQGESYRVSYDREPTNEELNRDLDRLSVGKGQVTTGPNIPIKYMQYAQPVRNLLELGGLAGGEALGGPIGGGLGYGAGKGTADWIEELAGLKKPVSTMGRLGQAATDVPMGAANVMGGRVVGKGLGALGGVLERKLPLVGKGTGPESQELMNLGRQYELYQQVPDITGHAGQAKFQSALSILPTSARVMQEDAAKSIMSWKGLSNKVLGKYGYGPISKSGYQTGMVTQEGMAMASKETLSQMDDMYELARGAASSSPIKFPNTGKAINVLENNPEYAYLPPEIRDQVYKVVTRVGNLPKDWTYGMAENERRGIVAGIRSIQDPNARRLLWPVEEAFEKDMEMSAQRAGSQAHKFFRDARDFAKQNVYGTFRGETEHGLKPLAQKIMDAENPEQIIGMMKSVEGIKEIKRLLPKDHYKRVKDGMLAEIFENSMREVQVRNQMIRYLDPKKIESNFLAYKKEYLRELLEPDEFKFLTETLPKLGKSLQTADRIYGNPSGTTGAWWMTVLIQGLAGGALGMVIGQGEPIEKIRSAIIYGGGAMVAPYILAKAVTSPMGRAYMLNGIKTLSRLGETGGKYSTIITGQQVMQKEE